MNKGYNTTTYESFDKVEGIMNDLLQKNDIMGVYFAFGLYTGLRISDILALKWEDIPNTDILTIKEGKTKKRRDIKIIKPLKRVIDNHRSTGYIFPNKQGLPFTREWINKRIKLILFDYQMDFKTGSSHFLRKSFSREIYNRTKDIALVMQLLNHSNPATTMRYIGITKEKLTNAYDYLEH